MNTENMIDVTGVNLVEMAQAAYDLSRPQGMGFLHFKEGPLSDDDARGLVSDSDRIALSMDYVHGRACKLTVFREGEKLFIYDRWFDHSETDLGELIKRVGKQ